MDPARMLTGKRTLELFPTLVTTFQIEIPQLDEALTQLVLARAKTTPSVMRGERLGWQSGNDFFRWSPGHRASWAPTTPVPTGPNSWAICSAPAIGS